MPSPPVVLLESRTFWTEEREDCSPIRLRAYTDSMILAAVADEAGEKLFEDPGSAASTWFSESSDSESARASTLADIDQTSAASQEDVDLTSIAAEEEDARTTLIFHALPSYFNRAWLESLLCAEGFSQAYDFVYVPVSFRKSSGWCPVSLNYAIVNFRSAGLATSALAKFQDWELEGQRLALEWCDSHQGQGALIQRYRNSAVMHGSIAECFKPAIFEGGVRVSFPAPTEEVRQPKFLAPQAPPARKAKKSKARRAEKAI